MVTKQNTNVAEKRKEDSINYVHKNQLLAETLRKERHLHKIHDQFSFNFHDQQSCISPKVNTYTEKMNEDTSEEVLELIDRQKAVLQPPKEKYDKPLTESQVIGWYSQPLLIHDKYDDRLEFPRRSCSITKYANEAAKYKSGKATAVNRNDDKGKK
ncbi:hypothetical protein SNEBB_006568 [Seison nebaliae]|nr:hypothetical protein SNEBB_006568 [Seison nebaliae]